MKNYLITFFAVCGFLAVSGQTPLMERRISVSVDQEPLEVFLKKISEAGAFTFSYNPEILEEQKLVRYRFVNRPVREVLDEVFKGTVQYKVRGKYIILTAGARTSANEPSIVTGYVVDEATGQGVRDVSIYDPITLTSTITDAYGYFKIRIDRPSPEVLLSVNRQNYADTVVVAPAEGRLMNIPIRIDKEKLTVLADSVGQKLQRFWARQVLWFENTNFINIDDTLYRRAQVSFVPFVGTNHKMSGHVINDYSFNILGGYALGVNKMEIGGLFNLERGHMKGLQFAGLFNGVGGEMEGAQFAGVMNGNLQPARGVQFAGVLNLNLDGTEGAQFAGVGNITEGLQNGPQIAGVFNLATQDHASVQLGGVYNLAAKNMEGLQAAGVFNVTAKNVRGIQLAGVMNIAGKEVRGVQVAGVLNFARKVKGSQLGLINIADSVKGVPVGLLSLVWKGYHKVEISADEIFYNNLSFRTGVRQFYNILSVGAKPSTYKDPETFWSFGYGVGTSPRLTRKLFMDLDVTAHQIVQGSTIEAINLLNKVYLGFDYQAFRKMSLAFGVTLNGYITRNSVDTYSPLFTDYQPDILHERNFGSDHNLKMWLGGKVALRFL